MPGWCRPPLKPRPRIQSIHNVSGTAGHASQSRFFASQPGSMAALPGRNGTHFDSCSAASHAS